MRAGLVAIVVLLAFATPAAAHDEAFTRYVAGGAGPCANTPHPTFDVGGGCEMHVHAGLVTIAVTDDVLGALGFTWEARDASGHVCTGGASPAPASASVAIPAGCTRVTVIPNVGATTGMVEIVFH